MTRGEVMHRKRGASLRMTLGGLLVKNRKAEKGRK